MIVKFVVLAAFVAFVNAGVIRNLAATSHASFTQHYDEGHSGYTAPALHYAVPAVYDAHNTHYADHIHKIIDEDDHHAPAHYDFEYSVHDPHTGDVKEQKESRQGDVVHGSYSFTEADGSKRTVEYTVDKHSGFNAIVHREPAQHPVAVHAVPDHFYHDQ